MRVKHHTAAREAGLKSLAKTHPEIAKSHPGKLARNSPELASYNKGAKPVLRKGFAKRAGMYGAGMIAGSAVVTQLQHHYAGGNTRARNKHPNA